MPTNIWDTDTTETIIADRAIHYLNTKTDILKVLSVKELVLLHKAIEKAVADVLKETPDAD